MFTTRTGRDYRAFALGASCVAVQTIHAFFHIDGVLGTVLDATFFVLWLWLMFAIVSNVRANWREVRDR